MKSDIEKIQSTLLLLKLLKVSAEQHQDPKPNLEAHLEMESDSYKREEIERFLFENRKTFSQIQCLENSELPISQDQIRFLRVSEGLNSLAKGYQFVIDELETKIQEREPEKENCQPKTLLNCEDIHEFFGRLKTCYSLKIGTKSVLETIQSSTSSPYLAQIAQEILMGIEEGKSLSQAMKSTEAFDAISVNMIEYSEKITNITKKTEALTESLKQKAKEKSKDWKPLAKSAAWHLAAALLVGVLLHRKKK